MGPPDPSEGPCGATNERRGGARSPTAATRAPQPIANAGTRNVPGATRTLPGPRDTPQRGVTRSARRSLRRSPAVRTGERSRSDTRPSRDARGVIRSMDQETTPAATAADPSAPPAGPAAPGSPRRKSSWGKVQVAPKTDERVKAEPAKRETQAEPAKRAPKAKPTKAESEPARSEGAGGGHGRTDATEATTATSSAAADRQRRVLVLG